VYVRKMPVDFSKRILPACQYETAPWM
jgi:hypothetical protein